MLMLKQWPVVLGLLIGSISYCVECKIFERCELANILHQRHRLDLQEVALWVCIAQHSSGLNTATQAYSPSGGSHGIFQISDVYWCSLPGKASGCNIPCHQLRDDNLADDISCAKRIYTEHQRISGNGYTAWNAYEQFCKNNVASYIQNCFPGQFKAATPQKPTKNYNSYHGQFAGNSIEEQPLKKRGKVYERCELARELYHKHKISMDQIPTWVCIAEHESRFNTAAIGRLNTDGSSDHGLFQISDLYWCSHGGGGKACGLSCSKLLDNDISDDVRCIRRIHNEHTAISGDGFNAWTVYRPYCLNQRYDRVASCFQNTASVHSQQQTKQYQTKGHTKNPVSQYQSNPFLKNVHSPQKSVPNRYQPPKYNDIYAASASSSSSVSTHKGKIYTRCSLAKELYFKHNFPMQDINTWVCIAEHESQFNTAAVGRLNTDGSADHGLFQISDRYWCNQDQDFGGKACNIPCNKLLDDDLRDDVECIKIIHEEHTRLSGDGFNAWTVYKPHCLNQNIDHVRQCFDQIDLERNEVTISTPSYNKGASPPGKGKVYKKCELAQELYHQHKMPMEQIPKWVCIAQHESSFNTAAVGRLNTDGSADHGLFQISDLYWCSHDQYGGKACNIPCDKLLDSDISDDVRCIKIIHEEHTRISGDGFNAWTVYKPHCRNMGMDHIKSCFLEQELKQTTKVITPINSNSLITQNSGIAKPPVKGKIYKKCELARELYHQHRMPMEQIPKWVCIAQHESSFNTAAVGRLNTDGSADHGLFQISDLYWCSHDQYGGKACNIPCDKLLDSDISDDVRCIKIIHEEHTRISGDGFNAWTVYKPHCRNTGMDHIKSCFSEQELKQTTKVITPINSNSLITQNSGIAKPPVKGKIYKKCELAQELYHQHRMPMEQIPKWVCIAQHESSFNTAAVGRLNTDGSADHGLFQISDLYWCSHDQYGGKACNIPCDKLLDSDISDDVRCIKIIHEEHTRISGDGFNAWTVYKPHCRNTGMDHIKSCFSEQELKQTTKVITPINSNSLITQNSGIAKPPVKGKIYKKCELAQELYHQQGMPMEQIPKWVCIAQHESSFNTAAVGRLNTDGSADHGLFQISDLYWCSHDQYGGKACNIPCDELLDSDISDDVKCIKIIHEEHTRISGDGFNAWTVYKPHCRNTGMDHIKSCFSEQELKQTTKVITPVNSNSLVPQNSGVSKPTAKGKIYKKCELAKELYHQHKMPMEQIPKWVCIAQHESSFNTAAVGRLNTDGSADHGLFQISDLYWCSHDQYGGKACNIPCDKLLDSDISDDVRCIKIIHEEYTRISGDGFNAWTVYKPHCRNRGMEEIRSCFTSNEIEGFDKKLTGSKPEQDHKTSVPNYANNPFLQNALTQTSKISTENQKPNFSNNPYLQGSKLGEVSKTNSAANYKDNPFLNGKYKTEKNTQNFGQSTKQQNSLSQINSNTDSVQSKPSYNKNPFLNGNYKASNNVYSKPSEAIKVDIYKSNPFLNGNIKTITSEKLIADSYQQINHSLGSSKPYLNSNSFRTTTTTRKPTTTAPKPETTTTTKKPITNWTTTTTRKPTVAWNTYTIQKTTAAWSTTKKPIATTTRKLANTSKPTSTTRKPTTTAPKPKTTTTTKKPITNWTTTRKPTVASNTYTNQKSTPSWSTTKKPIATTTRKSITTLKPITTRTTMLPKTTTWNWKNQKYEQSTLKPGTTKSTTAKTTSDWNYKNQNYGQTNANNLTTRATTTNKPKATTTTTKSWQNKNYANLTTIKATTTNKPKTTATWSWQNQKFNNPSAKPTTKQSITTKSSRYFNTTTTKPLTTKSAVTSWNWLSQKHNNSAIKTTALPKGWNSFTTKLQTSTTTSKPLTTNWNWRNEQYQKTTKSPTKTTAKNATKMPTTTKTTAIPKGTTNWNSFTTKLQTSITTSKPLTTTWNWRNEQYQKPTKSIAVNAQKIESTTRSTTRIPITTKSPSRTTITTRTTTTTKRPTTKTMIQQTLKPNKPIHNESHKITPTTKLSTTKPQITTTKNYKANYQVTTPKSKTTKTSKTQLKSSLATTTKTPTTKSSLATFKTHITTTTKSSIIADYEKFKKDPFQHPFFAKVNEQIKQLRGNATTTKRPTYTTTKLQNFTNSSFYNFNGQKLPTTTKLP